MAPSSSWMGGADSFRSTFSAVREQSRGPDVRAPRKSGPAPSAHDGSSHSAPRVLDECGRFFNTVACTLSVLVAILHAGKVGGVITGRD